MPQDKPHKRRLRDKLLLRDRSRDERPESPIAVEKSCQGRDIVGVETGFVQPVTTYTSSDRQPDVVKVQTGPRDKSPPSTEIQEGSLWARAYEQLHKEQPTLAEAFSTHLGLSNADLENQDLDHSRVDKVAEDALTSIQNLNDSKRESKTFSDKISKHFQRIIKMIIASKDFISVAASLNPYAALAWSGVSMLLPVRLLPLDCKSSSLTMLKLLLNSSQEAEAAIAGLDQITNLMMVYKWKEKSFFEAKDFKHLATRLYTAIIEYQALLLDHTHRNPIKKWAKDVFSAGDWADRLKAINQHDARCREVTDAIEAVRTKEWRYEERSWQDRLLQQLCRDGFEERRNIRSLYSNYEADKNLNPERIMGTCEWFLSHSSFMSWRESQSSSLLLVTADPGCGKSVLAKYLVDRKGVSLTAMKDPPTICYFFFKDGDPKRMNSANAVCALLHQLILQYPHLYKYAREDFLNKNETFLSDFDAVWNIFLKAVEDPLNSEIICVLDALDECSASSRDTLIARLEDFYGHSSPRTASRSTLKFLVTSRPDFNVLRAFKTSINSSFEIRLRGEEESEQISREIDLVIRHKVQEIGVKMDLSASEESDLKANLLQVTHRTYLWLHLTLDFITKKLDVDRNDIAMIAKTLPATVEEAYIAILNKSPDRAKARRLLHIVLSARRPLTLQEMNVALEMNDKRMSHSDLRIWPSQISEERIKNICGLFLSVVDSKIYLIHQTAREFLTRTEHTNTCCREPTPSNWKNAYCPQQSNMTLAQICIDYLGLKDFQNGLQSLEDQSRLTNPKNESAVLSQYEHKFVFLTYSAEYWGHHFRHAGHVSDSALIKKVALVCSNPMRPSFDIWIKIFVNASGLRDWYYGVPGLVLESYFGHDRVVESLLALPNVQVNESDENGETALIIATREGHEAIVQLLLDHKEVEVNARDVNGRTALNNAARHGHEHMIKLLLAHKEVEVDARGGDGLTALSSAVCQGFGTIVNLLLAHKDIKINTQDSNGLTALNFAIIRGDESMVKLLLAHKDLELNIQHERWGMKAVLWAAMFGHESTLKLLLDGGAQLNLRDEHGRTALFCAAQEGEENGVRVLLISGARTNIKNEYGDDPYSVAVREGHVRVAQILEAHDEQRVKDGKDKVSDIEDEVITHKHSSESIPQRPRRESSLEP